MHHIKVLLVAAFFSTSAFAMPCPSKMAEIDSMLETNPPTDSALRPEGEELHKAGDHAQSSEVLSEAIALLESAE